MIYGKFIAVVGILTVVFAAVASADIVKYTDEKGVIHFTNRERLNGQKVYMKTPKAKRETPAPKNGEFRNEINEAAARNGLDPKLIESVIKAESDFDPDAVSGAGARGLMQLMPETAALYNVKNIHDPKENIDGGTMHFKRLLKKYKGDVKLALAAYNAGETAVEKYSGIPPYPETVRYVAKVLDWYGEMPGTKMSLVPRKTIYRYEAPDGTVLLTDTPQYSSGL